jgi:hypothetical protein
MFASANFFAFAMGVLPVIHRPESLDHVFDHLIASQSARLRYCESRTASRAVYVEYSALARAIQAIGTFVAH